jgi:aldose 1-epimerase
MAGKLRVILMTGLCMAAVTPAWAKAVRAPYGALADGTKVEAVTLTNSHGVSARILSLGAILQSLVTPDRNGKLDDIVLGYDKAQTYYASDQYFGATVGRYANRIAKGKFSIDGKSYQLATNNGVNALHGGVKGFNKRMWKILAVTSGPESSAVLQYVSADGEEGYPGKLTVLCTYSLNEQNELKIEFSATTDKPTVVNLTNHSFFNLSGLKARRDTMDEKLTIDASRFNPIDATSIPKGPLKSVAGTVFDFRKATPIGARIRDANDEQIRIGKGYDHNYAIDGKAGVLHPGARLEDPWSGRVMDMTITAPGIQFYSGNFLDGGATAIGKMGYAYRQGDAVVLEPQVYPDTPNRPDFPTARLDPGQTYSNVMVYRFSTEK